MSQTIQTKDAVSVISKQIKEARTVLKEFTGKHDELTEFYTQEAQKDFDKFVAQQVKKDNLTYADVAGFLKEHAKTNEAYAKRFLAVNETYAPQIQELTSTLGPLCPADLKLPQSGLFATGKKALKEIQQDILPFETMFNSDKNIYPLKPFAKRLSKIVKDSKKFQKTTQSIEEYAQGVAFFQNFVEKHKALYELTKTAESISEKKSVAETAVLLEAARCVFSEKYTAILDDIENFEPTKVATKAILATAAEDKKFHTYAKLGIESVVGHLQYFVDSFDSYDLSEDGDYATLSIKDAADHLDLSLALFAGNLKEIDEKSSMDTASRELINERVWDYIRSEKFYEALCAEKPRRRKM